MSRTCAKRARKARNSEESSLIAEKSATAPVESRQRLDKRLYISVAFLSLSQMFVVARPVRPPLQCENAVGGSGMRGTAGICGANYPTRKMRIGLIHFVFVFSYLKILPKEFISR